MKFSVIVVSLNAGEKLIETVNNILAQKDIEFEIVIKDGLSNDGSLDAVRRINDDRIKIHEMKDTGIYDGMNQGILNASGDFYIFMNCGDNFYDENVLARFEKKAEEYISSNATPTEQKPLILYGSRYSEITKSVEYISPKITPLVCYRNIPCHQAILYSKECFAKRLFRPEYKVRADYEHFLWSVLKNNTATVYVDEPVCRYEGGGYSDNPKQAKRSADEHKEITGMYLSKWQLFYCHLYMILTLQPLRHAISTGPLSGLYNSLVKKIYRRG
jgi:glycosyltransferase involved in cell wall biosynthesis